MQTKGKHPILVLIACTLAILSTLEAKASPPDTSTTQKLLQYIFKPLDKTQVPRGFLQEYGVPIFPLATFNGTPSDSNTIDINLWRTLYFQMQTSFCGVARNPLPDIKKVNKLLSKYNKDTLPIAIPILMGSYSSIRRDAFSRKLLVYDKEKKQVMDPPVPNYINSAYDINNLFISCPSRAYSKTNKVTFICDSSLFWNNVGKNIYRLKIDFGDGRGFRNVYMGVPITINYTQAGRASWTIKAILTDSTILECNSSFFVAAIAPTVLNGQRGLTLQNDASKPSWGAISYTNPANKQVYHAQVYIKFSQKNVDKTLQKPLIVIEGFDASHIASVLQPNYSIKDFIKLLKEPIGYNLYNKIDETGGYDIVFIDLQDGAADITMNAKLVEEAIRKVNENKAYNKAIKTSKPQNVVMGLGMGGLCARYGLAEMTKNKEKTETRLLITHDSPHHGLNMPLGLQYILLMMDNIDFYGYKLHDIYPEYNDAVNILKSPAMVQMLIYRASSAEKYNKNTFMESTYQKMVTFNSKDSQPTYRFVATSLGNECGNALFDPGKPFIRQFADSGVTAGANTLFFSTPIVNSYMQIDLEAYSMPQNDTIAKIARVFARTKYNLFGLMDISQDLYKETVTVATKNFMALDGVAGSIINLHGFSDDYISSPQPNLNLNAEFPFFQVLSSYTYPSIRGTTPAFTFVPISSALDVTPMSVATFSDRYVNGINPRYPSSSETFIAQETSAIRGTTNNVHEKFTARNAEWIFDEMESKPNLLTCPYNGDCASNYYVHGDSLFCSNATYFVSGLPRGASVKWAATTEDQGVATITAVGNKGKLARKKDGFVTVRATILNGCKVSGGGNPTISKSVYAGLPKIVPINGISFKSSGQMNPPIIEKGHNVPIYHPFVFDVVNSNIRFLGSSSAVWEEPRVLSGPPPRILKNDGQSIGYKFYAPNQMVEIKVDAQNKCGTTESYYEFVPNGKD